MRRSVCSVAGVLCTGFEVVSTPVRETAAHAFEMDKPIGKPLMIRPEWRTNLLLEGL